jgi:transposase-like protein
MWGTFMKRRQWDSKLKAAIVLEGLQGRNVAEICNDYGISSSQYYTWREQFLSNASQAFETGSNTKREAKLVSDNKRLKGLVGELTMELKKSDW